MVKRAFDIVLSAVALLVLSPGLLILGMTVALSSPGGAFFRQVRVGRAGKEFRL
ncbi:MAG: sugar transferase, partial [Flavobacteriales bacterium]|nr:sugar transferase [Flavobacteriales bacterium]